MFRKYRIFETLLEVLKMLFRNMASYVVGAVYTVHLGPQFKGAPKSTTLNNFFLN